MPAIFSQFARIVLFFTPVVALLSPAVFAQPGRGATAEFERGFLEYIIDHHYSALRMTEIAAGTDPQRDAAVTSDEGTSPSPDTEAVESKALDEAVRSLARQNNRAKREHILTAQRYLRDWYGVEYNPQVSDEAREAINALQEAQPGDDFDQVFLENFSRHQYQALTPSLDCVVGSDVEHTELIRFCHGMLDSATKAIQDMREHLAERFAVQDFQPFPPAGDDGQPGTRENGDLDEDDNGNDADDNGDDQTDDQNDDDAGA
ncbi:DUF305 domain-containing protein [Gilvimarinus sp. F26214L]|uniref:DUF305 domain-containing protein n=1 Tax=Gilvimarinus sp. DZF01 TaxID=3461371 RepID=UPI0040458044